MKFNSSTAACLFKDEVRALERYGSQGSRLASTFPGPGLAVRLLGDNRNR